MMTDVFARARALLQECLEYPGTSHATLAMLLQASSSSIGAWIRGETTPKDIPHARMERVLEEQIEMLRQRGADPRWCDEAWKAHLTAHLESRDMTVEAFAAACGADARFGRRWMRFGEVPSDRHGKKASDMTGYDFDAQHYHRAIAASRRAFGSALPAPLDAACDAATLRTALTTLRERAGMTIGQIAHRANVSKSQYRGLSSTHAMSYTVETIADFLTGLARFVKRDGNAWANGTDDDALGIIQALALLRSRPPAPQNDVSRATVAWEAIEHDLAHGSNHRAYRFRCMDGTPLAVALVRLCIAYEQSGLTLAEAATQTDVSAHALERWIRARTRPDVAMLEKLAHAITALTSPTGRTETRSVDERHEPSVTVRPTMPAAPPPKAVRPAPVVDPAPLPDDAASEVVLGMVYLAKSITRVWGDGRKPPPRTRGYLKTLLRDLLRIADMQPDELGESADAGAGRDALKDVQVAFGGSKTNPTPSGRE